MKRIKLVEKPESPLNQGLRRGIQTTAVAFVPILLWLLGMIGYQRIEGDLTDVSQPSATEMPAPVKPEKR
ncbi:MAG: hypothetical protein DCF25_11870 [Leptolyngbya foveolarum]|uniref:Uncharacterized protein n=1 Tax=Leptolyngbya foveolarum TaxID=47253 RepID=A0A2W4W4C8_9CYAN|nr:MAG: hypothetical protein DCF25_11870 [Leptolyngbya foveolarum]